MVNEVSVLFKSQTDCVLACGRVIVVVPVTFTLQSEEASVYAEDFVVRAQARPPATVKLFASGEVVPTPKAVGVKR